MLFHASFLHNYPGISPSWIPWSSKIPESYFKDLLTQDLGFEILKVFLYFCYCFIVFRHN